MLEDIEFEGNQSAQPLIQAIASLKAMNTGDGNSQYPTQFASAKWRKLLGAAPDIKLWETAILFAICDALRSRDIWMAGSQRYQDTRHQLLPAL